MQALVIQLTELYPHAWYVQISPESGAGMVHSIPCHSKQDALVLALALSKTSPIFYLFKG